MEKTYINTLIWSENIQESIRMNFLDSKRLWDAWSNCQSRFIHGGKGYNLDSLAIIWMDKDFWEALKIHEKSLTI